MNERPDVYFSSNKETLRVELREAVVKTVERFKSRAHLLGIEFRFHLRGRYNQDRRVLSALQWEIDAYEELASEVDRSLYDDVEELQARAYRIALKGEPSYFEYMKAQEKQRAERDVEEFRSANISFEGDEAEALVKWRGLSLDERARRKEFIDHYAALGCRKERPISCPCGQSLSTTRYEKWCEFKKAHAGHDCCATAKVHRLEWTEDAIWYLAASLGAYSCKFEYQRGPCMKIWTTGMTGEKWMEFDSAVRSARPLGLTVSVHNRDRDDRHDAGY